MVKVDVVITDSAIVRVDAEQLRKSINIMATDIRDGAVHVGCAPGYSLDMVKRCFSALGRGKWEDDLVEGVEFWILLRAARAYDCLPEDLERTYRGRLYGCGLPTIQE